MMGDDEDEMLMDGNDDIPIMIASKDETSLLHS